MSKFRFSLKVALVHIGGPLCMWLLDTPQGSLGL